MLLSRQFRLAAISLLSERQRRGRGGEGEGSWGRGGGGKWETFSEGGLKQTNLSDPSRVTSQGRTDFLCAATQCKMEI